MNCPLKYKLQYIEKNFDKSEAIHFDIGNILHKVLEIKYRNIIERIPNDYDYLRDITLNGIAEETEKDKGKFIIGINEIREKYGKDVFVKVDPKSELSYDDKLELFFDYLMNDNSEDWKPIAVELPFEFIYDNKVVFNGFIDRIDQNSNGELRVVDYKSSGKPFADKDLVTPLQMVIYSMACEQIYGTRPIEYQYDLILLDQTQQACTKGYYDRGVKKINKVLDEIEWCSVTEDYKPKATPLCHWCSFSETNPNAEWYTKGLCEYYCLWTPEDKTFKKNKEYN